MLCKLNRYFILILIIPFCFSCQQKKHEEDTSFKKPNIVIIYADDLGYGDVGFNGGTMVSTPNLDAMATNGLVFADAHSSASTCTPSRYSLLTGSHAFRNQAKVLPGDAPLLIRPGTPTIASHLKQVGYTSGVVGKWHLGLGNGDIDWNKKIVPGPAEIGFDYSFLIPATGDRVPCVFVENQEVVNLDKRDPINVDYRVRIDSGKIGMEMQETLKMKADEHHSKTVVNGISRIGYMTGGKSARWKDEDFADILSKKARDFISDNKANPFFLFFSFHDIHVPRIVHERFQGKSEMGPRGDAIIQMDWVVGQLKNTLDSLSLTNNTLIVFSSDNGPVLNDGYEDQSVELISGHTPAGEFSGGKYSIYEAGTRMPTLAYWPGTIKPGKSNALISQIDLYHSVSQLIGTKLEENEAPDSFGLIDVWLGNMQEGRSELLEEAYAYGYRKGAWKYIAAAKDTSIFSSNYRSLKGIPTGISHADQLYNLEKDPEELENVALEFPDILHDMKSRFKNAWEKPTRQ